MTPEIKAATPATDVLKRARRIHDLCCDPDTIGSAPCSRSWLRTFSCDVIARIDQLKKENEQLRAELAPIDVEKVWEYLHDKYARMVGDPDFGKEESIVIWPHDLKDAFAATLAQGRRENKEEQFDRQIEKEIARIDPTGGISTSEERDAFISDLPTGAELDVEFGPSKPDNAAVQRLVEAVKQYREAHEIYDKFITELDKDMNPTLPDVDIVGVRQRMFAALAAFESGQPSGAGDEG